MSLTTLIATIMRRRVRPHVCVPVEVAMSDCPYGCKVVTCCGRAPYTAHSAIYGCPKGATGGAR